MDLLNVFKPIFSSVHNIILVKVEQFILIILRIKTFAGRNIVLYRYAIVVQKKFFYAIKGFFQLFSYFTCIYLDYV